MYVSVNFVAGIGLLLRTHYSALVIELEEEVINVLPQEICCIPSKPEQDIFFRFFHSAILCYAQLFPCFYRLRWPTKDMLQIKKLLQIK